MDEDVALGRLVALRKQRPTFARMISWEIRPHEGVGGTTCDQAPSSGSDGEACAGSETKGDNSNDSDESEYFSAEERSLSDSDAELLNQSADYRSVSEGASVASDYTDSVFDSVDTLSNQPPMGRNRAPSKKQRKRRKDRLKKQSITYADYDAPFRNVDNIDFEVADLVGDSFVNSRPNIRNVPTLFELCLRTVSTKRSKQKPQSTSTMPRPMKHVLYERKRDQAFTSIQLSWLYRLLAFMEKQEASQSTFKLQRRNIWNDDYVSDSQDYIGGEVTSILPYSYINKDQNYRCTRTTWYATFYKLSAMASVIEIMLPQHISAGRLRHSSRDCSSESQLIQKTTDAMVSSLKEILKKRYPGVVNVFFDDALPYVFWARGNIQLAVECFVRLAQTREVFSSTHTSRPILLSEAARIYAQNDEPQKAYRLYTEASDAIMAKSRTLKLEKDAILQQLTLMASVYDQGVMTSEKATLAAGAWAAAIKNLHPTCPWSSGVQAVDSLLCFHAGTAQENIQDYLEKSVKLIEGLIGQSSVFLLHLSMVKALQGAARDSLRAFSSALTSGLLEVPQSVRGTSRKHNAWKPVLDHVAEHGTPKFLKVIWRTQLGHLRVVNSKDSYEGDYQAMADLNLRLTDTGFLTADLQMVLPPIRALNLDPYTGLHLHTTGLTHQWHSLPFKLNMTNSFNRNGQHIVPTLTEMYRDDIAETVVHLLSPDASLIDGHEVDLQNSRKITLFWKAAGQRAKLNLIPFVKEVYRKNLLDNITSTTHKDGNRWNEEMKMSLDYCFAKDFTLSKSVVETVKNKRWNDVVKFHGISSKTPKVSKKKKQGETVKKKPNNHNYKPSDFSVCIKECFAYKDTLYLSVSDGSTNNKVQVFVDCTSKTSFLNPVVRMDYSYDTYIDTEDPSLPDVRQPKTGRTQNCPQGDIMWRYGLNKDRHKRQFVFGKKGELLKTIAENQMVEPFVLGKKLYGLSGDRLRVRCDPITADDEVLSEELPEIKTLLFGGNKVMAVTDSAIYFLHSETLQILNVTQQQDSSSLKVSDDGCYISFPPGSPARILEQKSLEEKMRLTFSIGTTLMFVDVTDDAVEIVMDILVPGIAVECYSLNGHGEFLVSVTMQSDHSFYREHVFHYDWDGKILGVLPFLGPGPRCFCVEYLKGWEEVTDTDCGRRGWHVFMRDGHEGIIGVRL